MKLDKIFMGLNISANGLSAQRKRMNAIANNLANAETTKTEAGGPYKRQIVQLKAKGGHMFSQVLQKAGLNLSTTSSAHIPTGDFGLTESENLPAAVQTTQVEDPSPPKVVYDPGNPEADENGYVKMPNVNVVTEMVGMIAASRAFEAGVQAINAEKSMDKDSLEI